jgi:predicted N-acetyltransferase YhbS
MGVNIRAAREGDLRRVVELLRLLHKSPDRGPPSAEKSGAAQAWKEMLGDPRRTVLVAEERNQVIATLDLLIVPNLTSQASPWALVENMVVAPTHRRRGIGRALIREVLARAEAAGAYKVQLLSHRDREEAHAFYTALGFDASAEGFRQYIR